MGVGESVECTRINLSRVVVCEIITNGSHALKCWSLYNIFQIWPNSNTTR